MANSPHGGVLKVIEFRHQLNAFINLQFLRILLLETNQYLLNLGRNLSLFHILS